MSRSSFFAVLGFFALVACGDPVRDNKIDALGPEPPGASPGPLHRPGQPCVVCHDGNGPGTMVFSFAGTVYKYQETKEPLANAVVRLVDAKNHQVVTGTNCAGNFFVQRADFDPVYPVWVRIAFGQFPTEMTSPIFREGSCANCHSDPATPVSAGHVYLVNEGLDLPGGSCP